MDMGTIILLFMLNVKRARRNSKGQTHKTDVPRDALFVILLFCLFGKHARDEQEFIWCVSLGVSCMALVCAD
jgi:hypothetical protein